jgi:hypothetical protein
VLTRRTWVSATVLALTAFALAQAPQPTPGPTPTACQVGLASGLWDLPDLGLNGAINGILYRGANVPVYRFTASLIDVPSPCLSCIEGDIGGYLDDGVGPAPDYVVRGHYRGAFFTGAGEFHAAILRPNQNVAVGKIAGNFHDVPTNVPHAGDFHAAWEICE